ncbi:DgyrCDS1340 [Dimorphilus gyrociliatus]|uniref:Leishmanolysin-like peptidase n=1 Tax=Dimorphilus gyrociliatus TaxID=2664684 RepID=A0A7I8V790_9ANNE|nr:DgyrCDS1340 [Dimorphilus gyrociliatus]
MLTSAQASCQLRIGFSASLFGFYRDENGDPLTPRNETTGKPNWNRQLSVHQWSNKVIRQATYNNWRVRKGVIQKTVHLVVTPNVVREVRKHFNCTSLEGAELENQGGSGTALTHWEKRIFEHEAMTGTYTQNPIISSITLALMDDTGWYKADYSMSRDLRWGKNLGCQFATQSCLSWMLNKQQKNESLDPFCNIPPGKQVVTKCDEDKKSVVMCNMVKYKQPLIDDFQNFLSIPGIKNSDVKYYGSSASLSDFCPFFQEFEWKTNGKFLRTSVCSFPENQLGKVNNFLLETYGKESRCFENLRYTPWYTLNCKNRSKFTLPHVGSACYKYECDPDNGLLVTVGKEKIKCSRKGEVVEISSIVDNWLHKGNIICPDCLDMCPKAFCPLQQTFTPISKTEDNLTTCKDIQWAESGRYENDLGPQNYRGPIYCAEELSRRLIDKNLRILDVAAGTGFLGKELAKLGHKNIDALEPSIGMIKMLKRLATYTRVYSDQIDETEILSIEAGE